MLLRLVIWFLKRKKISKEDRMLLTATVLNRVGGIPLHGIISLDGEGNLLIRGAKQTPESLISLRESADALQNNQAWKLIHEHVLYQAVSVGALEGVDMDQVLFSRAGIWFAQREQEWASLLAGTATDA